MNYSLPTVTLAILAIITLFVTGCASSLKGDTYSRVEARRPQVVRMGTIEALRPVQIEGTQSKIGAGAGAVVGGIAGSSTSRGKGGQVMAVIGAVAGGIAGAAIEEGITRTQGVEITIQEDNGAIRAYVQEVSEGQVFRVGERVRILSVDGKYRVTH